MGRPSKQSISELPRIRRFTALAACAGIAFAPTAALAQQGPRTADEASQANLQGALLSPLRDVNLMRDKVPEALNAARGAPYVDAEKASCEELAAMIAPLEAALGPDAGEGVQPDKPGAGSMVYGAVAGVARDAIPFRGVVRQITGAARQDQKVQDARQAGHLRRAYLKGFASAKGCNSPNPQDAPQQVAQVEVRSPPPAPAPAPPIAVASLEPPPLAQPAPPPAPEPVKAQVRFNLPESWRAQLAAGTY